MTDYRTLIAAGDELAATLDSALETHIYEPGETPDDAPELAAIAAWEAAKAEPCNMVPIDVILAELQRRRLDEDEGEQLATEYDELLAFVRALVPPCNTAAEPPALYEEEPEERRTGLYRVRFFMLTTTCDRHSIQVRASSPEAAKARVDAWRRDLIDLTHDEETTENLDKEMDVTDSTYDGLAEQPWDEPTELEAPEQLTEGAQGDPLAAQADA